MSYILEALKRADAERTRGQVPSLHSLPLAGMAEPPSPTPARDWGRRTGWTLLGLLGLLGASAVAWWISADAPRPPATPSPTAPTSAAGAPATRLALAHPTSPPAPILQPAPNTAEAQSAAAPLLPPAPTARPKPMASPASSPAGKDATVPKWADLPTEQRQRLPDLRVNGASFSQNPAHRMLIVNGQVVQEGQDIVPGLRVERIGPHEAVLDQRGLRFSIGY